MRSWDDLEARLRRDADVVRRAAQPGATLHHHIMVRLTTTDAAPPKPWVRRLATQVLPAVALVLLAAGIFLVAHQLGPTPAKHGPPPAKRGTLLHNGQIVLSNAAHDLIASDPVTGQFHTLLSVPTNVIVGGAAYSPDGSKLAYLTGPGSVMDSIWVLDTATRATKQLTVCMCQNFSNPTWSPDGSRLAFSAADPSGGSQLYLIDADGTHKTQLTHIQAGRYAWEPNWSPDGTHIAFATYSTDPASGQVTRGTIDIIRPDGTGLVALLADVNATFAPAWSPDGSRIAYVLDPPSSTPQRGAGFDYQLWLMDTGGSHRTKVFVQPGCCIRLLGGPVWSPDGSQIAFVAGALWVINADGSQPRNLGMTVDGADTPTWQPVP